MQAAAVGFLAVVQVQAAVEVDLAQMIPLAAMLL
jgi:hypothetical protein